MERETIRALASRWAEIAALPVMDERVRGWRALHDLRPERPMVLLEVGTVDAYVRADELRCTNPVLRAVEATMLEHIRHFDEVGDDIAFEPYYRLGRGGPADTRSQGRRRLVHRLHLQLPHRDAR